MPTPEGQSIGATLGEEFVRSFGEAWEDPTPAGFEHLFAPQIRLVAPLLPATNGRRQAEDAFGELLRLLPDLTATVVDWVPTADGVMIDHVFAGAMGTTPVRWRGIDRFVLRADGRALERVHFADSLPMLRAAASNPRLWLDMILAGGRPLNAMPPSPFARPVQSREAPNPFSAIGATAGLIRSGRRGGFSCHELRCSLEGRRGEVLWSAVHASRDERDGPQSPLTFYDAVSVRARLWAVAGVRGGLPAPARVD